MIESPEILPHALIDYAQEYEIIDTKVVFKDDGFVNDVEKSQCLSNAEEPWHRECENDIRKG